MSTGTDRDFVPLWDRMTPDAVETASRFTREQWDKILKSCHISQEQIAAGRAEGYYGSWTEWHKAFLAKKKTEAAQ